MKIYKVNYLKRDGTVAGLHYSGDKKIAQMLADAWALHQPGCKATVDVMKLKLSKDDVVRMLNDDAGFFEDDDE